MTHHFGFDVLDFLHSSRHVEPREVAHLTIAPMLGQQALDHNNPKLPSDWRFAGADATFLVKGCGAREKNSCSEI